MSTEPVCPACGRDRGQVDAGIRELLRRNGFSGETVNPGGRELRFSDGRTLQLHDQCSNCDADTIRGFLDRKQGRDPSLRRSGQYWARFRGPIGDAIGPMLCETLPYVGTMKPLRAHDSKLQKLVDGEWKDLLHDGGPIEPGGLTQGGTLLLRRDRLYDPVLRLVLCRLLRKHRWMWCSMFARNAGGQYRRLQWHQCRLCGEQTNDAGYLQPKKPWPRGDQ